MTRTRNRRSCNVNRRGKAYLQRDAASAVSRKDGLSFTTAETKGLTKELQTVLAERSGGERANRAVTEL